MGPADKDELRNFAMDFMRFLHDQADRLTEKCQATQLWDILKGPPNMSTPFTTSEDRGLIDTMPDYDDETIDFDRYDEHLSVIGELPFLGECIIHLRATLINREQPGWTSDEFEYLAGVLYSFMRRGNTLINVRVHAVLILMFRFSDTGLVHQYHVLEHLYVLSVDCLVRLPFAIGEITKDILMDMLSIAKLPATERFGRHMVKLCYYVGAHCPTYLENFEYSDVNSSSIDIAFGCINAYLHNTSPENLSVMLGNVAAALAIFEFTYGDYPDSMLTDRQRQHIRKTIETFYATIMESLVHTQWFDKFVVLLATHYGYRAELAEFFKLIPFTGYIRILEEFTDSQCAVYCKNIQSLVGFLLMNRRQDLNMQQYRHVSNQLWCIMLLPFFCSPTEDYNHNLRLLLTLTDHPSTEIADNLVEYLSASNNIFISRNFNFENISNSLIRNVDVHWLEIERNQLIINILASFTVKGQISCSLKFARVTKVLLESEPMQLQPCLSHLRSVITHTVVFEPEVSNNILHVLTKHAISPSSMSREYVRDLYQSVFPPLLSVEVVSRQQYVVAVPPIELLYPPTEGPELRVSVRDFTAREIAYRVGGILADCDGSRRVFQRFKDLSLLSTRVVEDLVNIRVTDSEANVWKIMYCALQVFDYTDIPSYMCNIIRKFIEEGTGHYTLDVRQAFFGTIQLILTYRRRLRIANSPNDILFYNLLTHYTVETIRHGECPPKTTHTHFELLFELSNSKPETLEFLPEYFRNLNNILLPHLTTPSYNSSVLAALIVKHLIICSEIITRFQYQPDELVIEAIEEALMNITPRLNTVAEAHNFNYIWSTCITFYGKLTINNRTRSEKFIAVIQNCLVNGSESMKGFATEALADICMKNIHNYDVLLPFLIEFLNYKSYLQVVACKALLGLINTSNIRLTKRNFLLLVSLLADENARVREVFFLVFENHLFVNSSYLIPPHFIYVVLHFNGIYNHPHFLMAEDVGELDRVSLTLEGRYNVYKLLLKYVGKYNLFYIMNQLADEVLDALFIRTLPVQSRTLTLLLDVYKIIYAIVIPMINENISNEPVTLYKSLLPKLVSPVVSNQPYLYSNYDKMIINVLHTATKLLYDIETINRDLLQDTFHLIMVMIKAFYPNVIAAMCNPRHELFRTSIRELSPFFNCHKAKFDNFVPEIFV